MSNRDHSNSTTQRNHSTMTKKNKITYLDPSNSQFKDSTDDMLFKDYIDKFNSIKKTFQVRKMS